MSNEPSISNQVSRKWNVEFLKEMSLLTDPYAEEIVRDIVEKENYMAIRGLFLSLQENDSTANSPFVNDSLNEYFNKEMALPEWADHKKIELAQHAFAKYGPEISLLLNYKALPLCYACKNGAKVLYTSGRMVEQGGNTDKLFRRLMETAQMVMNVMSPGGLDPKGDGVITVKKVRLYHAAIRYFLLHKEMFPTQEAWDVDKYGYPINQEEMAGTLMAFSALVIKGLDQIGLHLSKEEKDAYIHCWNIVGHFIGLDPRLYPQNYEEGWELGVEIIRRNYDNSMEGKVLTQSLIDCSKNFIPGKFFDGLPEYFISYFIHDVEQEINVDISKELGIDDKNSLKDKIIARIILHIIDFIGEKEEHNKLVAKIFEKFNIKMLEAMINHYLKTSDKEFFVPQALKTQWNLNPLTKKNAGNYLDK